MSRLPSLLTLLVAVSACSEPPNGPSSPYPQSAVPASPATPPPAAPDADLRRSFIWSEEEGFTILPNPPGVILVSADAISDAGDVTGTVIEEQEGWGLEGQFYRAFKWSRSSGFTYFPYPGISHATGIDGDGNVVAYTEQGSVREVFIWKASGELYRPNIYLPFLHTLGIVPGGIFGNQLTTGGSSGVAPFRLDLASGRVEVLSTLNEVGGGVMGVNSRGDAVGYDGNMNYGFGGTSDAVIWDRLGKHSVVFACNGEDDCFASLNAVNADGLAVGSVTRGRGAVRVFRWSPNGGVEFLEVPQERGRSSILNLADDGSILVSNGQLGFILRSSGDITTISPPPSHQRAQPRAMNNRGQVVGMLF